MSEMLTWISEATTHTRPWLETIMSPQPLVALDAIKRVYVQKGDEVAGEKRKEEIRPHLPTFLLSYFLFRFARGGSPAASVLVSATAREESMDLGGSDNGSSSSATSDVLFRPSPVRADCSLKTLVASVSVPEADTETTDLGTNDVLSSATTSGAPTSLPCASVNAVKNDSKSKSVGVCGGSIPPSDVGRGGGGCVEVADGVVVASAAESNPMFSMKALILACSTSTSASISLASWYVRARRASSSASWVALGPTVSLSLSNVSTLLPPPILLSWKASCASASWGRSSVAGGVHDRIVQGQPWVLGWAWVRL
ncbi:hypothetical protein BJV77DRAFT_645813 [Russula vinacea]|nr:hypothetical protein BJV77DRAFT_645813 [Russula vinacea]